MSKSVEAMRKIKPTLAALVGFVVLTVAVSAWAAGGGHGGGHSLHVNWWTWDNHAPPIGWFILDFLLFVFLLVKLTKKPVSAAFAQRHKTVRSSLDEAKRVHDAATEQHETYSKKLDRSDEEAKGLLRSAEQMGSQEKSQVVDQAAEYAARLREDSERLVTQEEQRALQRLQRQAARQTLAQTETFLREHATDADRQRLVEDAIASLETMGQEAAA